MANTYYDSRLTAAEIEQVLEAISGILTSANNGKVLAISDGTIEARSVQWGGGEPVVLEPLSATANGDYTPEAGVDGFDEVHVSVPNSYSASDEGKVVSNGVLVAQTARGTQITQNGTYDTTLNNEVTVDVSGGGSAVVQPLSVTQNGTYNPPSGVDGYSPVVVNVSGGGGSINWKDPLSVNWDFSNPVNTRGSSSYNSTSEIYTIDGWSISGGILTFATGGILLDQKTAGTAGYFLQRFPTAATSALSGKTLTLSAIVDGEFGSVTAAFPSSTSSGSHNLTVNGVGFRIYRYSSSNGSAITIDIGENMGSKLIQAIKLEAGSSQTLATQINGIWVLNNSMDADTEYIRARLGYVKNS